MLHQSWSNVYEVCAIQATVSGAEIFAFEGNLPLRLGTGADAALGTGADLVGWRLGRTVDRLEVVLGRDR